MRRAYPRGTLLEASALDGIGFTVPGTGESRLGRIPAQPARSRIQPKKEAPRYPVKGSGGCDRT